MEVVSRWQLPWFGAAGTLPLLQGPKHTAPPGQARNSQGARVHPTAKPCGARAPGPVSEQRGLCRPLPLPAGASKLLGGCPLVTLLGWRRLPISGPQAAPLERPVQPHRKPPNVPTQAGPELGPWAGQLWPMGWGSALTQTCWFLWAQPPPSPSPRASLWVPRTRDRGTCPRGSVPRPPSFSRPPCPCSLHRNWLRHQKLRVPPLSCSGRGCRVSRTQRLCRSPLSSEQRVRAGWGWGRGRRGRARAWLAQRCPGPCPLPTVTVSEWCVPRPPGRALRLPLWGDRLLDGLTDGRAPRAGARTAPLGVGPNSAVGQEAWVCQ